MNSGWAHSTVYRFLLKFPLILRYSIEIRPPRLPNGDSWTTTMVLAGATTTMMAGEELKAA